MTPDQMNAIREIERPPEEKIAVAMLANRNDRTLVFGYDVDRNTFHLFIRGGELRKVVYRNQGEEADILSFASGEFAPAECVPNKRVYPERCDFEFCHLVAERGVMVPFTTLDTSGRTFDDEVYHGRLFDDVFEPQPAPAM